MKRFLGMMPSAEVEKEKSYKDENDLTIRIQAGPHGWTVIYADGGTNYKDEDDTTENNFQKAYEVAKEALGELTELCCKSGRVCCGKSESCDCASEVAN